MLKEKMYQRRTIKWLWIGLILILLLSFPAISWAKINYDLVIHYIQTEMNGDSSYLVKVYFSVIDGDNNLQKDLAKDDVKVTENGKQITIDSFSQVTDEKKNIILVIDTSGISTRVNDEKEAATNFIKNLERDDTIGIVSFSEEVKIEADIDKDHDKALGEVKNINAVPYDGGDCLYDAIYQAEQMMAKQPVGRRSIIVFSDNIDKKPGSTKGCSSQTVDDVIKMATDWNTRLPVYTIQVTESGDEKNLKRIAEKTGGRYRLAKNSSELQTFLADLSNQFQNEYVLQYTSQDVPGDYTIVVDVDKGSIKDQDTRSLKLIQGVLPTETTTIETPQATNTSQAAGSKKTPQPAKTAAVQESVQATDTPQALGFIEELASEMEVDSWMLYAGIAAVVIFIIFLIIIFIIIQSSRKSKKKSTLSMVPPAAPVSAGNEATMDGFVAASKGAGMTGSQIGALTIMATDDTTLVGKVLSVNGGRTSIGRSAENDIVLSGDRAVSREHAIIEQAGSKVYFAELVSQGADRSIKRPTYGTYVNDIKIGQDPVELNTGDVIRLGTRCKMRFEKFILDTSSEATVDGMSASGDERTIDGGGGGETVGYQ